MKLKTGMLHHMSNTFRNTIFYISDDMPLIDITILICLLFTQSLLNVFMLNPHLKQKTKTKINHKTTEETKDRPIYNC